MIHIDPIKTISMCKLRIHFWRYLFLYENENVTLLFNPRITRLSNTLFNLNIKSIFLPELLHFFSSFWTNDYSHLSVENWLPLKPVLLGDVRYCTFIISHEQTPSYRVYNFIHIFFYVLTALDKSFLSRNFANMKDQKYETALNYVIYIY